MKQVIFNFEMDEEYKKEKEILLNSLLKEEIIQKWMKKYNLHEDFIERHVYKFKDYVENKKMCKNCKGLSLCMQKKNGYILELEYDGVISKNVCACQYLKDKAEALMHKQQFLLCDMSDVQLQYSFEKINMAKESVNYFKLVKEMHDATLKENPIGFYLCGEPGSGKTYLACCFINAMAKKGKTCAFVNVSNYISKLKTNMYDKDAFAKQIDALKRADVVVLDDIGGESVSNWSRDEILLPILNERMENNKTTLFTSNYSIDNLQLYYAANSKFVNDQVGAKRLIERMKTLSFQKVLNSGNRRLKTVAI